MRHLLQTALLAGLPMIAPAATFHTYGNESEAYFADVVYDQGRDVFYLSDEDGARLLVFDAATLQFTDQIYVGAAPQALDLAPNGDDLLISSEGLRGTIRLNLGTGDQEVIRSSAQRSESQLVAASSDAFFAHDSGERRLFRYDLGTNPDTRSDLTGFISGSFLGLERSSDYSTIVFQLDTTTRVYNNAGALQWSESAAPSAAISLHPDGSKLAKNSSTGTYFYDISGNSLGSPVQATGDASGGIWDPSASNRYWRCFREDLYPNDRFWMQRINSDTGAILSQTEVDSAAYYVGEAAIDSTGTVALFVTSFGGQLGIFSSANSLPATAPPLPELDFVESFTPSYDLATLESPTPFGIQKGVFEPDSEIFYYTANSSEFVHRVDVRAEAFLPPLAMPTGFQPYGIEVTKDDQRLFLAGSLSGDYYLYVLDINTGAVLDSHDITFLASEMVAGEHAVYLVDQFSFASAVYDLASQTVTPNPSSAFDRFGNYRRAYTHERAVMQSSYSDGQAHRFDTVTMQQTPLYTPGEYGDGAATNYDGTLQAFHPRFDGIDVLDVHGNFLAKINGEARNVLGMNTAGNLIFAEDYEDNDIIFDTFSGLPRADISASTVYGNRWFTLTSDLMLAHNNLYIQIFDWNTAPPTVEAPTLSIDVAPGQTASIPLYGSDADGHCVEFMTTSVPALGSTSVTSSANNGLFTFVPEPAQAGQATSATLFAVEADYIAHSLPITVNINVLATAADMTSPTLVDASYAAPGVLDLEFSELMGAALADPATITLSGTGRGSLNPNPDHLAYLSGTTYRAQWDDGSFGYGPTHVAIDPAATDLVGNTIVTPATVTVPDTYPPTFNAVTFTSDNASSAGLASAGSTVTVAFTTSEPILSPSVTIGGQAASVSGADDSWSASLLITGAEGEGPLAFTVAAPEDPYGNVGTATSTTTDGSGVTLDLTGPMLVAADWDGSNAVLYSFNETMGAGALDPSSVTISGMGQGTLAANPDSITAQGGNAFRAVWSSGAPNGEGQTTFAVDAPAEDLAGNAPDGSPASLLLDDIFPPAITTVVISSNNSLPSAAIAGNTISLEFTASEPIAGMDVTIAGRTAAVNGGPLNFIAEVLLDGSEPSGPVAFSISNAEDLNGNSASAVTTTTDGSSLSIDDEAPSITSALLASNNARSAEAASAGHLLTLNFTASEAITTPTVSIAARAATAEGGPTSWQATLLLDGSEPEGPASISIADFSDLPGNAGTPQNALTGSPVTLDFTNPTVALTLDDETEAAQPFTGTYAASDALSGVDEVILYRWSGSAWDDVATYPDAAGSWTDTPAAGGPIRYAAAAADLAGNQSTLPALEADALVSGWFNPVLNGQLLIDIPTSATAVTVVFPMTEQVDVAITFDAVSSAGTLSVERLLGDLAPPALSAASLMDFLLEIETGGGLAFSSATITVNYTAGDLGGLAEVAVTRAFRVDDLSQITELPITLDPDMNTISVTTSAFSDWYFGAADAGLDDWMILSE